MAVVRVVLAVALASALLGASLPAAERAERDRHAAVATGELEAVAGAAERLAAENDPVAPGRTPARETVSVVPPRPTFTDGGRIHVADDTLVWQPATGPNRTVGTGVSLRVETPIVVADRARLRLSLVRIDGDPAVRIERVRGDSRENRRERTASRDRAHRRPVGAFPGGGAATVP